MKKKSPKKKATRQKKKAVKKRAPVLQTSKRTQKKKTVTPPAPRAVKKRDQLILGIDLGTSQTAVMSDRGHQSMFMSVVGYPKDIIAVKLFEGTHIIGEDALNNQSSLDLYVPLENGTIKEAGDRDLDTARILLQHVVELTQPRSRDKIGGIIGVPAQASMMNKEILLKLAGEVMDVALVVSEPFLVAYALNRITNSIIVDIGAGTIDVCGVQGALPGAKDQITFYKAGNYIDRRLEAAINASYPSAQVTRNQVRKIKEKYSFVGKPEKPVVVTLRTDGKPAHFDLTEEIRTVCESIVPEIVEKVSMLVPQFDPEDQEEALGNIFLAGGGSKIRGLDKMIVNKLKEYGEVIVIPVDNPNFIGCLGALKMASDMPPDKWDQIGLIQSAL
ncbi:MAG: MamK family actin-like protein [Thermodesulfobacteriota bacterium]